jgi:hypothetical protein
MPNRELVERRLPCGGWTRDIAVYKAEWSSVGAAITGVSGWRLESFDPDFMFRSGHGSETVVLPLNFVRAVWVRQLNEEAREASRKAAREAREAPSCCG